MSGARGEDRAGLAALDRAAGAVADAEGGGDGRGRLTGPVSARTSGICAAPVASVVAGARAA